MRRVLALLLAINLLIGLWLGLRAESVSEESEFLPASAARLELVSDLTPDVRESRERCAELGPFSNEDLLQELPALNESVWSLGTVVSGEQSLYRVYLGPAADRAGALVMLAEVRQRLEEAGLNIDSYVVAEGVLDNAVSLGLFSNIDNAERVRDQLLQLGYDVQLEPETRRSEVLWLSAKLSDIPEGQLESWRPILAADGAISISENLCETIAHRK